MSIVTKVLDKVFGKKSDKDRKAIEPTVDKINEIYSQLKEISNDALRQKTIELKEVLNKEVSSEKDKVNDLKKDIENLDISKREELYKEVDDIEDLIDKKLKNKLDDILPEAFAIMKETARRFFDNDFIEVTANENDKNIATVKDSVKISGTKAKYNSSWTAGGNQIRWNMIHYDVQLIGGVVLNIGKIAEMATGEGKTLVATLPVFLNALTGRGVHIVTVNDYLARRDAEWMGPLYEFHGLSVDCIDNHQPNSDDRRKAYMADVTFGTNNEFGFDYLRDNMAISPEDLVQRRHNYAIVDEVDSVLIDDARTPLIISGAVPRGDKHEFDLLKPKIATLVDVQKKLVSQLLSKAKQLIKEDDTKEGGILLLRAFKGLPKNKAIIKYLSEQGMKTLMLKTEDVYLAENAKRMPEITDDLYFVIDEKNNSIDLTDKGIDLITAGSDDPEFFILPDIGSEIAEIEKSDYLDTEKEEKKDKLHADYAIKSERVHTINQLLKAYTLFEKDVEYVVIDNKVKIVDEQTGRIMEGRRYSDGLHQAIEARENVKIEAATQTLATVTLQNYFRMYKKLAGMTGTAETEAGELWDIYKLDVVVIPTNKPIVRDDRNDLVYKTKREKYNAIIGETLDLVNEGRPVLVGTTSVEISELLSRMLKMKSIKHNVLNAKMHKREADVVAEAGIKGNVTIATNMAGRGTDIKLSDYVISNGGLAIIGTERHESRRVDRQLRGRSGRQGDAGESQFFVSLEDDLMRMFGSDRISKLMDRMGVEDGEVIQHSMISKSIERAQKKIEENNFGIRKRLLEYDDVMNSQREVIYKQRRHALHGERIGVDIANMMYDVCESIVFENHGNSDYEYFKNELILVLSISSSVDERDFIKKNPSEITEIIYGELIDSFNRRVKKIQEQSFPVIENVYKKQKHRYKKIEVPISDGSKIYNVVVDLKKAYESKGKELVVGFQKSTVLATIDEFWKEHLREMDELKQSVQNATYEQKDPLLIYKFESFELFKQMVDKNNREVVSSLMKGNIYTFDESQVKQGVDRRTDYSKYNTEKGEENNPKKSEEKPQPVRVEKKTGRNAPCPCGSGKKFKHCHGRS